METSATLAIKSRLDEVQGELTQLEADFQAAKKNLDERSKPLKDERAGLRKALEALEKITGTNGNGPSTPAPAAEGDEVSYEALIAAVEAGGDAPRKTPEIAEAMGVGPRKIARKLKKLADEGKIAGEKDGGYYAIGS